MEMHSGGCFPGGGDSRFFGARYARQACMSGHLPEKQAADYILSHMEEAAELPLDRLAHCAGVSQPTVLRMLKALGFDGYKDFRYQLVAELARLQPGQDQADQLMYGYTLSRQDTLEEFEALSPEEREEQCRRTEEKFLAAGADRVYRTLNELAESL